ncbi:MAG: citrate transporter [Clostridia bacterium]|nr:citrate transporter [Clostridia bacterium]
MVGSYYPKHTHHGHLHDAIEHIGLFVRKNTVFVIAVLLALVTSIIVPPDMEYISYFDFKTLTCLFATLAVICALKNVKFFTKIAEAIVSLAGNARMAILMLVCITFIGSMLIANDMALLTFLPLGYYLLSSTGKEKYMAYTFVLQNIAANLGGMLTPFGNPQNLYIYEKFGIPNGEFMRIMFPPFALAVSLIILCCLPIKREKLTLKSRDFAPLPRVKTAIYLVLFAFSVALVFKIVPYYVGLIFIPFALFFLDRKALKDVDYILLFTFVAFFIFAGNMSRIEAVREVFSLLLKKNTLVFSALSCQVISNVPSAILLSQFTENYSDLLVGVNIGGTGTIIASLASLITFKEYASHGGSVKRYMFVFSALNFGFLAIMLVFCSFVK